MHYNKIIRGLSMTYPLTKKKKPLDANGFAKSNTM